MADRYQCIIANDAQAADMSRVAGRLLMRAVEMLDRLRLTPEALRHDDLTADGLVPQFNEAATELIDRAADLLSDSAGLADENDENERRWQTLRARVDALASTTPNA